MLSVKGERGGNASPRSDDSFSHIYTSAELSLCFIEDLIESHEVVDAKPVETEEIVKGDPKGEK